MTPAEGDWVATHALPDWYMQSSGSLDLVRTCRCHYGITHHCDLGRHTQCGHTRVPEWYDRPAPDSYLVGRSGGVVAPVWHADAWDGGAWVGCRWRCPCDCHTVDPWTESKSHGAFVQPSLFEAA